MKITSHKTSWSTHLVLVEGRGLHELSSVCSDLHRRSVFVNRERQLNVAVLLGRTTPGSILLEVIPGPICRCVDSYRNRNLHWAAGMSSAEFPFKETKKYLVLTSSCDSAIYLMLIQFLTGVFFVCFCFAGRNLFYFQHCTLPSYLVVGTLWINEQNLNWGNH